MVNTLAPQVCWRVLDPTGYVCECVIYRDVESVEVRVYAGHALARVASVATMDEARETSQRWWRQVVLGAD